jgi:hypothetical protein
MTDDEKNIAEAEDLTLEGAEGENVVGGHVQLDAQDVRTYDYQTEFARLSSIGFVEESCTTEGSLMVNAKTGQRTTLKF